MEGLVFNKQGLFFFLNKGKGGEDVVDVGEVCRFISGKLGELYQKGCIRLKCSGDVVLLVLKDKQVVVVREWNFEFEILKVEQF